ncbi:GATA zinc finger domain-containing protein 4-like [Schistocerca serialis cubense]|uniref:GATA zinc finger domain-containing protein 4-like n=1 Tax=Schistocerca serialis cubense TaxID=2023355 RepID=UPI00214F1113|nr:GATA zinc finger domain-containing protein 4-like [Schistocerca serialis cubense]
MEEGKVEIVSADELSELDSSCNQQESPRFPPWTSSQINAMILPQSRNICDNTQMATLNDEMRSGRETRPSAPLLTSMSEPNMRQIQQCDTNRTKETYKLDRLLELLADMNRDVSQKIDILNHTMTENFERTTKQMTELSNTTQQLSQRFETLSDRVTKQEETLVTFTHETKNNITRYENQLTQIVNVQQEVNTRVEELAQAHTSASSTQEKLTEEVGNITQQLTKVVLEQTHLKENIEKLEKRADLASLNNDTNMAERIVHECKLCDDYLDKKLETITQDILSKAKTHVKDETKHIEDKVTKLRDNVAPCLVIGVSSGNDKTAKTMANDTDRTPIVESHISNQNYNVPLSFPPNKQYYDTTPRVASDTNYVNTVMPTGMVDDTQYNNNNNRRRENNRYNPGYFDRNMTYNRHNYHQNNNNPNNHRQNMWNTQNSLMTNHNPPRNPLPFPSTVMYSPTRSSNNNCGAPSADMWAPTGRNVNIVELVNEPGQTQQTTENSRRPS